MTYKTCQNIYSEHCHVLLERYQEGVACVVQQMRMNDIYDHFHMRMSTISYIHAYTICYISRSTTLAHTKQSKL